MRVHFAGLCLLLLIAAIAQAQNQRDLAVREDKETLENDDSWFYEDLVPAVEEAAQTNRPLMIVFR